MNIDHITEKIPVTKGWSGDQKYRVTDTEGTPYLLRISPMERFERKKIAFRRMQEVAALGIPMCLPVEFGTCGEGVYSLQSWIEGSDAEEAIASMPPEKQYAYGLDSGRILRKIHTLPAPADAVAWSVRYGQKIDRKIAMYENCPLKYKDGDAFLKHIAAARHLLDDRIQTYQHGDYHIGNLMIDTSGQLTVIDFDRDDWGDPWEEFNRIVWCAQAAPAFASGMVDGYFDGPVPMEFWSLLALYICTNTLSSLPWAVSFGDKEIRTMRNQAEQVLQWYDHFHRIIPSWYIIS